jgi:type II secretory pathway pseudopilin PulG
VNHRRISFAPLRPRRRKIAFTLAETMVAMAVTIIGLVGVFAAISQAIRIVRSGREIGSASQMLQQRLEGFRYTPPWTNITTDAGIRSIVTTSTATSTNFRNVTETFVVQPYPAGGVPLIVTRNPDGTFSTTGSDMAGESSVKFTITVAWTGIGNVPRVRQLSTIMTKGGL